MVAEPVAEQELPTTEVAEVTPPEPAAPPEPEASDDIPEEAVLSYLKEAKLLEDSGTAEGDADGPPADASGPDLSKLSPQQILELGKQQGKSETQTEAQSQAAAYQRSQRIEGAKNTLNYSKNTVSQILVNSGLDAGTIMQVTQLLDQFHGAWNLVVDDYAQQAQKAALDEFNQFSRAEAVKALGESKGKKLLGQFDALPAAEKSSSAFWKLYTEAARDGTMSASDYNSKFAKDFGRWLKEHPQVRDAAGFNQATRTNTNAATGGANLTYARMMALPIEEYEKVPAATRNRLAAQEAARRERSGAV